MKTLIAILLAAAAAYFAWTHFKPLAIDGEPIADDQRVLFMQASGPTSVADHLANGRWTLVLFTAPGSTESDEVERRMETAVRQRVKSVRLVIIDVGGTGSAAAASLKITKLPTAMLFDGYNQRTDDIEEILKALGA